MKRIATLVFAMLLLVSLAACTDSHADAQKKIEKVLGDVTQLPMELEQSRERLGSSTISGKVESKDNDTVYEAAIGSNVVLFSITTTTEMEMRNGDEYPVTVRALCVGTAKKEKNNRYQLYMIGGNFTLTFDTDDAQNVADRFASDIEDAFTQGELDEELPENEIDLWKNFARGEKVWATSETYLWEVFADLDSDLTVTYDADTGSFRFAAKQSVGDSWEETYYPDGRLKSKFYYSEGSGGLYLEEYYSYPEEGGTELSFTHYSFSNLEQVSSEGWYYYAGELDDGICPTKGWDKHYSDGTISHESSYYEDGTQLYTSYDPWGRLDWRTLYGAAESQGKTAIIWEESYEEGVLSHRREIVDENTTVTKYYYSDGSISGQEKCEGKREDGCYITWEYYNENGDLEHYRYYYCTYPDPTDYSESEEKTIVSKYFTEDSTTVLEQEFDENWNLLSSKKTTTDQNGNRLELEIDGVKIESREYGFTVEETGKYYENGYIIWTFHANGRSKTCEWFYEEGKTYQYREWTEAGVEIKYYKYNEAGEMLSCQEYRDDGTQIYSMWYDPDETDWSYYSETWYYENGKVKSSFDKFPDGGQRTKKYCETGEMQYFKFVHSEGNWYETYYYLNGQEKYYAYYDSNGVLAGEGYYLEDGTRVYWYVPGDGILEGEKPDWELP